MFQGFLQVSFDGKIDASEDLRYRTGDCDGVSGCSLMSLRFVLGLKEWRKTNDAYLAKEEGKRQNQRFYTSCSDNG